MRGTTGGFVSDPPARFDRFGSGVRVFRKRARIPRLAITDSRSAVCTRVVPVLRPPRSEDMPPVLHELRARRSGKGDTATFLDCLAQGGHGFRISSHAESRTAQQPPKRPCPGPNPTRTQGHEGRKPAAPGEHHGKRTLRRLVGQRPTRTLTWARTHTWVQKSPGTSDDPRRGGERGSSPRPTRGGRSRTGLARSRTIRDFQDVPERVL